MAFGGLGWQAFISPALADHLAPYNMAPGILGEATLTVWLLAVGVSTRRWNEQAARRPSADDQVRGRRCFFVADRFGNRLEVVEAHNHG